jgi:hypothetical protein
MGRGEPNISFREIYLSVLPGPSVNVPEPFPVHGAEIGRLESVLAIIDTDKLSERAYEFLAFYLIHFPLAFYAAQIAKDSPLRTGLELTFDKP